MAKQTTPDDPRGLIHEAFNIEGVPAPECRSIFLDWALEPREEMAAAAARLLALYEPTHSNHPMTAILQDAAIKTTPMPKRRGGRARRH